MTEEPKLIPRVAVRGIATGLVMMAVFTMIWSGIAYGSLDHGLVILIVASLIGITFIANAIYLFRISKRFPDLQSEADKAEEKRTGKWFGIIFGAEGLGIFIAVNLVINLGYADLTIAVIALVVGLHFYPLAKVFKRTIDYYLATWTTLIAICAIVFILRKTYPVKDVDAFVGIGTAVATSCYGFYMMIRGWKLEKPVITNLKTSS
jgi:hypothetical protein